jgi:hypothetical protein
VGVRWRRQLLRDTKTANHKFVDLQPSDSRSANRQPTNCQNTDGQRAKRERAQCDRTERLRAGGACWESARS